MTPAPLRSDIYVSIAYTMPEGREMFTDGPICGKQCDDYNETTLHFLFMGTNHFSSQNISNFENSITVDTPVDSHLHKQLHFIPTVSDLDEKELFFQTCNAMLHARLSGETFGLAVAEFSVRNLPVITYPGGYLETKLLFIMMRTS